MEINNAARKRKILFTFHPMKRGSNEKDEEHEKFDNEPRDDSSSSKHRYNFCNQCTLGDFPKKVAQSQKIYGRILKKPCYLLIVNTSGSLKTNFPFRWVATLFM